MKDAHELEIYAPIDGFPNYLVTSKGRVLSLKNIKIKEIKPFKSKSGYYIVSIYKNKKSVHKSVHRLVAQAFIPNSENKPQVNHINEIKTDNRVENLEWATSSENINYGSRNEIVSQKNSISHKGKKLSNETKEKLSKLNKGERNPMYGKNHNDESKQKMSKSHLGVKHTQETKQKISKASKGRIHTQETKQKIANSHLGVKHTQETKQKIANSRKGKKLSEETKEKLSKLSKGNINPNAKSVIGFKINGCDIKYYKYIKESKKDGFNPNSISLCCRKINKSSKGYIWYYTEEYFKKEEK